MRPLPQLDGKPWTLTARWVLPVDGPPLERGLITIQGERIAAVEPRGTRAADYDLGNVALLPGLVNAHTHLDLSGLRGKCPPSPDFVAWLKEVIRYRRVGALEQTRADIRAGLAEALRHGTTLLGDIAAGGVSWEMLATAPLRAVVYYELLGLPAGRAEQSLQAAEEWLKAGSPTVTCRPGWSPHAPYSVSRSLFRASGGQSQASALPLAIHLAETLAEKQLLNTHEGPFVSFLEELGVWAPNQLVRDWEEILRLTASARPVVFIHANYLPPDAPLPPGGHVLYCPRTHAAFGHSPYPLSDFLARGIRVAFGTDSLASNPDLDLLAEARFAHVRHSQVDGATLVRMATLAGAEALGWAAETGSLTPGKSADLVALPLPNADERDPHLLVLESSLPVQAVLWRGRWRVSPGFV
jgi:cytosine/adenosine deaminase-related metal-dependent hydrolase